MGALAWLATPTLGVARQGNGFCTVDGRTWVWMSQISEWFSGGLTRHHEHSKRSTCSQWFLESRSAETSRASLDTVASWSTIVDEALSASHC
jgi:hypothetical protein